MQYPLKVPGFEGKQLVLKISPLISRARVFVDGKPAHKEKRRTYRLKSNSGENVLVKIHPRILDPVPDLEIRGRTIQLEPRLRWYEQLWITLPLFLILTGGALGVFFGLASVYANSRIFRSLHSTSLKLFTSGMLSLGAVSAYLISTFGLQLLLRFIYLTQFGSFLDSLEVHDVHNTKHASVTVVGSDTTRSPDEYGYPRGRLNKLSLLDLLRKKQFKKLNSILTLQQQLFEKDFHYEDRVIDAFGAYSCTDQSLEPFLDEWVEQFPDVFVPYVVRGNFYANQAWVSRGSRWASETTAEQFQSMQTFFNKALEDLKTGLELRPTAIAAYISLSNILRGQGDDEIADKVFEKAALLCPYSFRIRERYMMHLLPRWGGSYEQMNSFANDAQQYVTINPRLRILKGFVYWDKAQMIQGQEEPSEEFHYIDKALEYGRCWQFLEQRGNVLWSQKKYVEALAEFDQALNLAPQNISLLVKKATMEYMVDDLDESLRTVRLASALDRADSSLTRWKQWAAHQLVGEGFKLFQENKFDEAIGEYDKAQSYHYSHAETYYYRGFARLRLDQVDAALSDFKRSIHYDPRHFDSYINLDRILSTRREWNTIISYWDQFIALEPRNARAYLERGGAYYQKGDFDLAQENADQACLLGDQDGCRWAGIIKSRH